MAKTLFITGTDTGIGKTTISEALATILKEQNLNVGYFKPIETGCDPTPSDGKILSRITGQLVDEIVLYKFKEPLAPYPASKLENVEISIEKILNHYKSLKDKYDYLIVEGAGGVCVPILKEENEFYTYVDLIKDMGIPVCVVSRAGLGTINHTVLTVHILKERGIELKGILMNGFSKHKNIAEKTNPEIIQEMTDLPVLSMCNKSQYPIKECIKNLKDKINKLF